MAAGRWFIVGAWLAAAVLATVLLPDGAQSGDSNIGGLIPAGSAAVRVEQQALRLFSVPVLSETSVVVYDPDGLSTLARADVALWAAAHDQATLKAGQSVPRNRVIGAVPVPTDTPKTAVTYLYVSTGSLTRAVALAKGYASHFHNQPSVRTFVTGIAPAQVSQSTILLAWLRIFGAASVLLVGLVIGAAFRSVAAPLVVLVVAAVAYLVTIRVLGALAAVHRPAGAAR